MNDNRSYKFSINSISQRDEYPLIKQWIKSRSKAIDLGCGDGSLLAELKSKGVQVEGVEISESGVKSSMKKGLRVKQGRIDTKLEYPDKSFDYSICNVTIQMVMYPEILLSEMVRISRKQILTFPNFAFILNRTDLLFNGRMPQVMIPGYKWYSTGHIHQLSINDFKSLCEEKQYKIIDEKHIFPKQLYFIKEGVMKPFPNLFASTGVFLLEGRI